MKLIDPNGALVRHPVGRAAQAPQRIGAIAAVFLHLVAVAALMSHEPARQALLEAAPIMVSLVTPLQPEKKAEPPKPRTIVKPVPVKAPEPLPLLVAAPEAPTPLVTQPPPPALVQPVPMAAPPAPTAPPSPAPVAAAVTPPVFDAAYLDNPSPAYPPQSRRLGEEGRVILRVLVNAAGRADEVQVRTGSGSRRLDDSAADTVKRWKFLPARRGAEVVPAWVLIPISFRLQS